MKKILVLSVLLCVVIIVGASYSYYAIATSPEPPPIINAQQLSSLTNMSWNQQFPDSKISQIIMNISGSGILGTFELKNNTSTTLSVYVMHFGNSTDANNTYINITNDGFLDFSSHFPHNSTIHNGTIYHLGITPRNLSRGFGINFTDLPAVHKNIFVYIEESGTFFSGVLALRILNWEVKMS